LWIQALEKPAVLPPHEEEQEVKTAIGAARPRRWPENGCCGRAERARRDVLNGSAAAEGSVALLRLARLFRRLVIHSGHPTG
jgi:hypothetical protein